MNDTPGTEVAADVLSLIVVVAIAVSSCLCHVPRGPQQPCAVHRAAPAAR